MGEAFSLGKLMLPGDLPVGGTVGERHTTGKLTPKFGSGCHTTRFSVDGLLGVGGSLRPPPPPGRREVPVEFKCGRDPPPSPRALDLEGLGLRERCAN